MPVKGAVACATILATGCWCSQAIAGPLIPPSGPPSSTDKPLAEVEPRIVINDENTPGDADSKFRITQRGSYYLIGSEDVLGVRHGIEIAADDVTIDLMGFTLIAGDRPDPGETSITLDGITVDGAFQNIVIRNGFIRDFGQRGVNLLIAQNSRLEHLMVADCASDGILSNSRTVIESCQVWGSGGNGFTAIGGTTYLSCTAVSNEAHGFDVGNFAIVDRCASLGNDGAGFHSSDGARLLGCVALQNDIGFDVGQGSLVKECVASTHSIGFRARNAGGESATIIAECTSLGFGEAYRLENNSWLVNSISEDADGPAVRVTGRHNRIDGNHISGFGSGGTGILVEGTENLIVRNTVNTFTNEYEIGPNNNYGPIVDLPGGAPSAIGASAPGTLGTSDPWANFSQ